MWLMTYESIQGNYLLSIHQSVPHPAKASNWVSQTPNEASQTPNMLFISQFRSLRAIIKPFRPKIRISDLLLGLKNFKVGFSDQKLWLSNLKSVIRPQIRCQFSIQPPSEPQIRPPRPLYQSPYPRSCPAHPKSGLSHHKSRKQKMKKIALYGPSQHLIPKYTDISGLKSAQDFRI